MASSKNVRFRMSAQDDTARGFRSVTSRFKRLGTTAKIALGNLAASFIQGSLQQAGNLVSGLIEKFDQLGKLAGELAISPQLVRQLQVVSQLVDISLGSLTRLLTRIRSGSESARKGIADLGLEFEKVQRLGGVEPLLVVVRALEQIEDQGLKTEAAVKIAGDRLGRDLVKAANVGSEALARLLDQQEKSAESANRTAAAAASIADSFTIVGEAAVDSASRALTSYVDFFFGSTKRLDDFVARWKQSVDEQGLLLGGATASWKLLFGEFTDDAIAKTGKITKAVEESFNAVTDKGRAQSEKVFERAEAAAKQVAKARERARKELEAIQKAEEQARAAAEAQFRNITSAVDTLLAKFRSATEAPTIDLRTQQRAPTRISEQESRLREIKTLAEQVQQREALQELVKLARQNQGARYG